MVKRSRRRRNRRQPSRLRSQISRIATGLPTKSRRPATDPPSMPISLTHNLRVRFNILHRFHATSGGNYAVELASTPLASNSIVLYYQFSNGATATTFDLSFLDVIKAAGMSLYGVDITKDPKSPNYLATEYSVRKVVLYGPDQRSASSEISLQFDAGSGQPGFVGRDVGDSNRRAVVSASIPRCSWRFPSTADEVLLRADMGKASNPLMATNTNIPKDWQSNPSMTHVNAGTLDITVMIRRSWANTLATTPTKLSNTTFV